MSDFNSRSSNFSKNVIQVYTEESGFTGYKGFDFTAVDDIENILRSELSAKVGTAVELLSGIHDGSVNVNQWNLTEENDTVSVGGALLDYVSGIAINGVNINQIDLDHEADSVSVEGALLDYVSGIAINGVNINQIDLDHEADSVSVGGALLDYVSGIAINGVNINQIDLDYEADSVSVGGALLDYVSGIAINGININQIDLDHEADSVSVGGALLDYVSGIAINGVNINQVDLDYEADSVSVGGALLDYVSGIALDFSKNNGVQTLLNALTVTGENIPSGITVYQANLNKDLDNISTSPIQSSTISNSTVSGSNGTIFAANQNRLELFVQNLATGALYVKYGVSGNNTSFNFVLPANSASNAGDGGSLSDQAYTGIVSVSGAVGPSYICWERS